MPNGEELAFTSRWDDSNTNNVNMSATLKKSNVKGTFFLTSASDDYFAKYGKKLVADGNSIGAHSMNHPILSALRSTEISYQIMLIRPLLEMLSTPESIIDWCYNYLMILVMGIAGTAYYNILCGVLRGLGDSVSALVYLLVATVINIVLDLWFVAGLDMGVAGVALATIIAQFISAFLCVLKLRKMQDVFDLKVRYLKINKQHASTIIKLGIPSGITQAIFSLAMIIVQSLTNSFGEMVIAANVIIMRVDGFAMMPNFSFGTAMTTYAGQNVGAGQYDRVVKGAKQGTLIAAVTSATITGLILIFGKFLMGMFTDTADLVNLSNNMMRILAVGYIAMAVTQCLSGVMRGAGDTTTPMWISIITTVIIRVPLAYAIAYLTRTPEAPTGSYLCLFISLLTSWVLGAVITALCYRRGRWRTKAVGMDKKALD
jgi:putative MATE family efflux protein